MNEIAATIFENAKSLHVPSGVFLFHAGDCVQFIHLIQSGTVSLERVQPNGQATCFQRAKAGDVLAEASVYSDTYHCDARVLEDVRFRRVQKSDFHRHLNSDPDVANGWAAHLARTVQQTRLNAEIRSFKTVRERLDAWLDAHGTLPGKGQWHALANELSVSREALYRELARRRVLQNQL